MHLFDYVNEIFDIAHVEGVDIGVAKDMFLKNIENAGVNETFYRGADSVDFAALKPHYEELLNTVGEYNDTVREHYMEIVDMRAAGLRDNVFAFHPVKPEETPVTVTVADEPATDAVEE